MITFDIEPDSLSYLDAQSLSNRCRQKSFSPCLTTLLHALHQTLAAGTMSAAEQQLKQLLVTLLEEYPCFSFFSS